MTSAGDAYIKRGRGVVPQVVKKMPFSEIPTIFIVIIIIIIIIIIIYCSWVVTRWQWLFYMYTKYEIGYY